MTLVYPMFALVVLTSLVASALAIARLISLRTRAVPPDYYRLMTGATPPPYVQKITRNFSNLLEVPLLFYVVCLVALTLHLDLALLQPLAWSYVLLRVVHTAIHLSYNHPKHRLMVFFVSCLVVLAMWGEVLLQGDVSRF
ncbi:MAG: MAPEG family protein [Hahellaceae bacterium]|nr:MAPEG family protein [Hahellaceae bacterium]MCP5169105.1 MAPEG family protein [Hahellaceae bacterium]